jgi:acetyl esterase/lipase
MHRRSLLLAGLASIGAVVAPVARARIAGSPRTYRYGETPGTDPDLQSLDLSSPPGQARPIIAFIHGGGWRIGDKATAGAGAKKARVFTGRGLVYASLNYRLSPAVMHPAHVEYVAAGLAWLVANAAAQGGDPRRIVVMGHSAGAHLAALVATDARRLRAHGLRPRDLACVILLDGAGYDLTIQTPAVRARGGFAGDMYVGAFGNDPAIWRDASPVWQANPAAPPPPFLILHTPRADAARQSSALAQAVRRAGGEATVKLCRGQTHASFNRDIGVPGHEPTAEIFAALRRWGALPA